MFRLKSKAKPGLKPILLLEINEVPWRMVDHYRGKQGFPNLSRFFASSRTYTTVAVDTGHLSPWVTWPSLHRGLPDTAHGVLNLGQDPSTFRGTPIWEEYRRLGHDIGIFGSMQSWPPTPPGPKGFYVPDTFAHDERAFPAYVEPLQRFNLNQVKKNGRVVGKQSLINGETLSLLASLPRLGITLATFGSIAAQLIGERRDRNLGARRPVFQTVLFWDLFKSLYHPSDPPAFSTFFTNHIAGLMHRYWHHVFPEDFGAGPADAAGLHAGTLDFAFGVLDRILGDAMGFARKNPDIILVLATSMGQAAVRRADHEGVEASVSGLGKLMSVLGMKEGDYKELIAMVPQVAVGVADAERRSVIADNLSGCRAASGFELFQVQEIGESLSITIRTPRRADIDAGGFHLQGSAGSEPGRFVSWEEAGITMHEVEAGTGYHIPEGILARFVGEGRGEDLRSRVPADKVKSMLMEWGGLKAMSPEEEPLAGGGSKGTLFEGAVAGA